VITEDAKHELRALPRKSSVRNVESPSYAFEQLDRIEVIVVRLLERWAQLDRQLGAQRSTLIVGETLSEHHERSPQKTFAFPRFVQPFPGESVQQITLLHSGKGCLQRACM
jgi:hypothetical protein